MTPKDTKIDAALPAPDAERASAYYQIVEHYEECFRAHGDTPKGLDWPNRADLEKRFDVMLGVIRSDTEPVTLLDFGCGTAMLYEYLRSRELKNKIHYIGYDLSATLVAHCRLKFPHLQFISGDALREPDSVPASDYVIMNGVFTIKRALSEEAMFEYMKNLVTLVFNKAAKGVAFNVMSKFVDWERDDLFHLATDRLIQFMVSKLSRHFVIRNDYGLYEYTTYLYKSDQV